MTIFTGGASEVISGAGVTSHAEQKFESDTYFDIFTIFKQEQKHITEHENE